MNNKTINNEIILEKIDMLNAFKQVFNKLNDIPDSIIDQWIKINLINNKANFNKFIKKLNNFTYLINEETKMIKLDLFWKKHIK